MGGAWVLCGQGQALDLWPQREPLGARGTCVSRTSDRPVVRDDLPPHLPARQPACLSGPCCAALWASIPRGPSEESHFFLCGYPPVFSVPRSPDSGQHWWGETRRILTRRHSFLAWETWQLQMLGALIEQVSDLLGLTQQRRDSLNQ